MNINRLLQIIASLLILVVNSSLSQSIVVSEVYNASTPNDEWTELVVIQDMLSLVNYSLRDCSINDTYPDIWQGGIIFTDNELWKNLRAGTIIVIRHRGNQAIDVDKSDGYIEVGAENTTYFIKNDYNGQWAEKSLSIDTKGDIVELLNSAGYHVHSLSFMKEIGGNYLGVSTPKLNLQDTLAIGKSISICPGKDLSDYSGGNISGKVSISKNKNFVTRGIPNKREGFINENLRFWQLLRAPEWNNPSLGINILPNEVDLYWNICSDINPSDNLVGYLIIRGLKNRINEIQEPKNGTTYKKGDSLGSAVVVDNFFNSLSNGYGDNFQLKCGKSYVYRVYAFCYSEDNILGNKIAPSYGRGRTYNLTNFAEASIIKTKPAKPIIQTDNDITGFCSGDSLKLTAFAYGGPYSYRWYLNGNEISGAKRKIYYAKSGGLYKVVIKNEKNCTNESDELEIKEMPSPQAILSTNKGQIKLDTTMILCGGESYTFVAEGGDRYEWFRNNIKINHTSSTFIIDKGGLYYAVAINNGMECTDTTVRVFIKIMKVDFAFEKDTLYYYLDKNTVYEDKKIDINNFSNDTLTFLDIIIPPGGIFSVSANPPSNIILPNQSKVYTVRFNPNHSGNYLDSIIFKLPCQNSFKKLYLVAYKEPMDVKISPDTIRFDSLLSCDTEPTKYQISIFNREDHSIELEEPIISYPFSYEGVNFPYQLDANSELKLTLTFYSNKTGTYNSEIKIPFNSNGIRDILFNELEAKVFNVSFQTIKDSSKIDRITFPELTGCSDSSKISIDLLNDGELPLSLKQLGNNPEISIVNLPILLNAKESKTIDIYFIPDKNGIFSDTLILESDLCNVRKKLILYGSKYGITFSFSNKNIDFDTLLQCQHPEPISKSSILTFAGETQDSVYIKKIFDFKTSYFSHNLSEGQSLNNTNNFEIMFNSAPEGEYFDTLSLLLMPCNIIKTLTVYGFRTNPKISFESDTIDFGSIEIDSTQKDTLQITNNGSVAFTISDIINIRPPFYLSTNLNFPKRILPDSMLNIVFNYMSKDTGIHNETFTISFSAPCRIDTLIYLKGRSIEHKEMKVLLSIPNNLSSELGKRFDIPIILKSKANQSLANANLHNITLSVKYNPTMVYPLGVRVGNALDNTNYSDLNFKEYPPGKTIISIKINKPSEIMDGVFFYLHCLALLGNEIHTNIVFDSSEFDSDIEIIPDTSSGFFTIYGDCNLEKRLLNYDNNLNLILLGNNPIKTKATIYFKTEIDSFINLQIYNTLGQSINTLLDGFKKAGEYKIDFETNSFQPGIYFAVLQSNSHLEILKLVVVR